jgi:hypothetical protein
VPRFRSPAQRSRDRSPRKRKSLRPRALRFGAAAAGPVLVLPALSLRVRRAEAARRSGSLSLCRGGAMGSRLPACAEEAPSGTASWREMEAGASLPHAMRV